MPNMIFPHKPSKYCSRLKILVTSYCSFQPANIFSYFSGRFHRLHCAPVVGDLGRSCPSGCSRDPRHPRGQSRLVPVPDPAEPQFEFQRAARRGRARIGLERLARPAVADAAAAAVVHRLPVGRRFSDQACWRPDPVSGGMGFEPYLDLRVRVHKQKKEFEVL